MFRTFFALGAVNAALAVAFGAFGAHVLEGRLDADMLSAYHTGAEYHFYHALGLLAVALAAAKLPDSRALVWSGRLLFAGIFLFSGSLYVLSMTGISWLGAITPAGGVSFIAGWIMAAAGVWPSLKEHSNRD